MCSVYKKHGAIGLISSGYGRDINELEMMGATFSGTNASHGYGRVTSINKNIKIDNLDIRRINYTMQM